MRVVTLVDDRFLPHARVLAESVRDHHERATVDIVLVDHSGRGAVDCDCVTPLQLGVSAEELRRRRGMYTPQQLISSLKPVVCRALLGLDPSPLLLIDADALVLAPLDDVAEMARLNDVVLSPHVTEPIARRADRTCPEELFLRAGVFNGGFLGLGPGALGFLDWWAIRTARDCVDDPRRGVLLSQTWLSLVPALFNCVVLRDAGVNLMWHRLHDADVDWRDGVPWIGRCRVRLFHFASIDLERDDRVAPDAGGVRAPSAPSRPGMTQLRCAYRERLLAAGWRPGARPKPPPWPDAPAREAYRRAVVAAEAAQRPLPPDPFADRDEFAGWLSAPAEGTHVPRHLLAAWRLRDDLRARFPAIPGADETLLVAWARDDHGSQRAALRAESRQSHVVGECLAPRP